MGGKERETAIFIECFIFVTIKTRNLASGRLGKIFCLFIRTLRTNEVFRGVIFKLSVF